MAEPILLWPHEAPDTPLCADQPQPWLDPYPVAGARGAVVVCPGGGYNHRAQHEGAPIAQMLNQQGIAAYVLQYRVHPCAPDTPHGDAVRAIRLVRSMGYDKVAIMGFSAGGHLCCSAAVHYDQGNPESNDPVERYSSRPDAFIPCYAVVSFGEYAHLGSRKSLLGEKWQDEELIRHYSNELQVTPDTPPAFIWHTAEDDCVAVQNSLMLAKALADQKVPFEMHVYPRGHHGLGLGGVYSRVSTWANDCCRWLLEGGFGR
ncbi:MAG: alpha/beta hydrolase [Clostridiales bacterium]|nr:alpha/beta hydrolase [Clostridiales bacterium]